MQPSDRGGFLIWILATIGLVAVATAVRFGINFSSTYPPGIDAAYYPVQTRSWMTAGRLMYDDLPLIFWLNAVVARALTMMAGNSTRRCSWLRGSWIALARPGRQPARTKMSVRLGPLPPWHSTTAIVMDGIDWYPSTQRA